MLPLNKIFRFIGKDVVDARTNICSKASINYTKFFYKSATTGNTKKTEYLCKRNEL